MSRSSSPPLNPIYLVVLGVTSVSFAAVFVRLSSAPAPVIAFFRLLIATTVTYLLAVASGNRIRLPQIEQLKFSAASGFLLALHFWSWFQSLKMTTVASSTVLVATQPLFVIIAARILYSERLSMRARIGLGIAILGTGFIGLAAGTGTGTALGNGLAILGAAFAAAYFLIGHKARSVMDVSAYTFWTYLACTVTLGLILLVGNYRFGQLTPVDWWAFLGLGLICHIGGHTSFNWALGYISPSVVATAVLGEPVGATLLAWLFFSEAPSWGEIIGGMLIIAGLFTFMGETGLENIGREKHETE